MFTLASLFPCVHPLQYLVVEKEQTTDTMDKDFEKVTYHLFCNKCRKPVKVVHCKTRHGVDAFLTTYVKTGEKTAA